MRPATSSDLNEKPRECGALLLSGLTPELSRVAKRVGIYALPFGLEMKYQRVVELSNVYGCH